MTNRSGAANMAWQARRTAAARTRASRERALQADCAHDGGTTTWEQRDSERGVTYVGTDCAVCGSNLDIVIA